MNAKEFAYRTAACVLALVIVWGLAAWGLTFFPEKLANPEVRNKFTEFDFAAYCFGAVAIAVSCAGVYLSVVIEPINVQLLRIVLDHFIPNPFSDAKYVEEIVNPKNYPENRTAHVVVLHAIIQLKRWQALEQAERDALTGINGLDAEKLGMGRWFCRLQNQSDRKTVLQFAVLVSALYAFVPILFFAGNAAAIISALFAVYILSVAEIFICAYHYWRRTSHVRSFESRLGTWRPDLQMFVLNQTKPPKPEPPAPDPAPA